MSFLACRVFRETDGVVARIAEVAVDDLTPGTVVIRAEWSGINFKDALGVTGRAPIYKRFPLNAGIDVAGHVESSSDRRFKAGRRGPGQRHGPRRNERRRVRAGGSGAGRLGGAAAAGTRLPRVDGLGTAGFTAALALHRMEVNGQAPVQGPIVVTGATGGVGRPPSRC